MRPFLSVDYKTSTGLTAQVCKSEVGGEESSRMCLTIVSGPGESQPTAPALARLLPPPTPLQKLQ